jgi:HNH endonuclease
MKPNLYPSAEEIAEVFRYSDGRLYWRKSPSKRQPYKAEIGAGCHDAKGYLCIGFKGRKLYGHRLIWILHHGKVPDELQIDHINRDRSDNRIENLRLATGSENGQNHEHRVNVYSQEQTHKQKPWVFHRTLNGRRIRKYFATQEEAIAYARDFPKNL